MREVIAYKKHLAGVAYIVITLVGILMLVSGFAARKARLWAMAIVVSAVGFFCSVRFLTLPSEIIVLNADGTLTLAGGTTVALSEIREVDYRRARGKGIRYSWGSLTVSTYSGDYRFAFVADCEEVAERLNGMVLSAKERDMP